MRNPAAKAGQSSVTSWSKPSHDPVKTKSKGGRFLVGLCALLRAFLTARNPRNFSPHTYLHPKTPHQPRANLFFGEQSTAASRNYRKSAGNAASPYVCCTFRSAWVRGPFRRPTFAIDSNREVGTVDHPLPPRAPTS